MRVLLVGSPDSFPEGIEARLADQNWSIDTAADYTQAADKTREAAFDAVVTTAPDAGLDDSALKFRSFLRFADARRLATVVVGTGPDDISLGPSSLIESVGRGATSEELSRRLSTLTRYHGHLRRMEQELEHMQRLGKRLHDHFRQIEDEMQLAASLQQDFLPREMDSVGPLRFASLYRPASWVSGDIFDVFRVDERHVGFYVADAVGHGVAAGLLTMFIKRAMVSKRVQTDSYDVLEPSETLRLLNDALRQHTLPKCQFVTVVYCLINTETLVMKFARGGHPYPILYDGQGQPTELKSSGGLMGLFAEGAFPTEQVQLSPGDKVVLISDGVESPLENDGEPNSAGRTGYRAALDGLGTLTGAEFVARLTDRLDAARPTDLPADDATVLVTEVIGPTSKR